MNLITALSVLYHDHCDSYIMSVYLPEIKFGRETQLFRGENLKKKKRVRVCRNYFSRVRGKQRRSTKSWDSFFALALNQVSVLLAYLAPSKPHLCFANAFNDPCLLRNLLTIKLPSYAT